MPKAKIAVADYTMARIDGAYSRFSGVKLILVVSKAKTFGMGHDIATIDTASIHLECGTFLVIMPLAETFLGIIYHVITSLCGASTSSRGAPLFLIMGAA
jgi:hypothetical protein